ncbi:hypothetical protein ABBQ32_000643 [Trebouxia sp. C0010 RCD-2024]
MRLPRLRYGQAPHNRFQHPNPERRYLAISQTKKVVYKNRIWLKEFFVDFDKEALPRGYSLETHFEGHCI